MSQAECIICRESDEAIQGNHDNGLEINDRITCQRCGTFWINSKVARGNVEASVTKNLDRLLKGDDGKSYERKALLSHKIRRSQLQNDCPKWTYDMCEKVIDNEKLPEVFEQIDNFLIWVGKNSKFAGDLVTMQTPTIIGYIGCVNDKTIQFIESSLVEQKLIKISGNNYILTAAGWDKYAKISKGSISYDKVFMAMKFNNPDLNKFYDEFLKPAVAATGLKLAKLNDEPKAGLIDVRMLLEIKTSKFLIADLSDANLGAYWEAGYAHGLGKEVIYLCEESVFNDPDKKPHFDINHHYIIQWNLDNPNKAINELKATIRYTFPDVKLQDDAAEIGV